MRSTIVLEFRAGSEDNIREYVAASAPQLGHQMAEVNDVLRARAFCESEGHVLLVSRYPGIN